MTKRITAELLRSHNACAKQVKLFEETFPKGVTPTLKLAERYADQFNWTWAAYILLTPAALAEYMRVAPARAEYKRAKASAWAEYERASAWAEYERVRAPAWAEYQRVRAAAFVRAWRNQ